MTPEQKKEWERYVFSQFASNSMINISLDTVESKDPPAPDILCKDRTGNYLAFELVEIVDEQMVKSIQQQIDLQKYYQNELRKHSHLVHCILRIIFRHDLGFSARRKASKEIATFLTQLPSNIAGDLVIPTNLKPIVGHMAINRNGPVGPFVFIGNSDSMGDPLLERMQTKFKKGYDRSYPIELLAFYTVPSLLAFTGGIHMVEQFILGNLQNSPFRRVWMFDLNGLQILNNYLLP